MIPSEMKSRPDTKIAFIIGAVLAIVLFIALGRKVEATTKSGGDQPQPASSKVD